MCVCMCVCVSECVCLCPCECVCVFVNESLWVKERERVSTVSDRANDN